MVLDRFLHLLLKGLVLFFALNGLGHLFSNVTLRFLFTLRGLGIELGEAVLALAALASVPLDRLGDLLLQRLILLLALDGLSNLFSHVALGLLCILLEFAVTVNLSSGSFLLLFLLLLALPWGAPVAEAPVHGLLDTLGKGLILLLLAAADMVESHGHNCSARAAAKELRVGVGGGLRIRLSISLGASLAATAEASLPQVRFANLLLERLLLLTAVDSFLKLFTDVATILLLLLTLVARDLRVVLCSSFRLLLGRLVPRAAA